jgi:hypothetical protein
MFPEMRKDILNEILGGVARPAETSRVALELGSELRNERLKSILVSAANPIQKTTELCVRSRRSYISPFGIETPEHVLNVRGFRDHPDNVARGPGTRKDFLG